MSAASTGRTHDRTQPDLHHMPNVLAKHAPSTHDLNEKGKPDHVLEKIVASGLKSYGKEHCLLDQAYIHAPSKSVSQALKEAESKGPAAPSRLPVLCAMRSARGSKKVWQEHLVALD